MYLIRFLTFSVLISLASHTAATAQKTVPAYLITLGSDTLRGELQKESSTKNASQVKFRPQGSEIKSYSASEIKGYGLTDSLRYEAREVLVDEKSQTIFMQVLVDGPVKLYYAEDFHATYAYFLQKQQEPVVPLHNKYYRGTLAAILPDCASLELRKYKYNASSLSDLVHTYNNCQYANQPSMLLHRQTKLAPSWGIRAAAHMFNLSYPSEVGGLADHDFGWNPGVTAGLFVNLNLGVKHLSLQQELLYTSRKLKNTHYHDKPHTLNYESVIELDAHYLQMPTLFKYTLGNSTWQPYLNAGFNYSLALAKDFKQTATYNSGYVTNTELTLDGYTLGYIAGAGIQHKALSLEARYSRDIANSNHVYKKMYYSAWQLGLGISF